MRQPPGALHQLPTTLRQGRWAHWACGHRDVTCSVLGNSAFGTVGASLHSCQKEAGLKALGQHTAALGSLSGCQAGLWASSDCPQPQCWKLLASCLASLPVSSVRSGQRTESHSAPKAWQCQALTKAGLLPKAEQLGTLLSKELLDTYRKLVRQSRQFYRKP